MANFPPEFTDEPVQLTPDDQYGFLFLFFIKFIYSEKATNFCEISTVDLSYVVTVKSTVEISQNFVAFSEYMNFNVKSKWEFFANSFGVLRIFEL